MRKTDNEKGYPVKGMSKGWYLFKVTRKTIIIYLVKVMRMAKQGVAEIADTLIISFIQFVPPVLKI